MALARGEKKRIVGGACAFLALAGVAIFYGYINATPNLTIPPRPQAPVPNGFDLALRAARELKTADPPLDLSRDKNPPADAKARAARYGLARKTAWLARNRTALGLLKQSQRTAWLQPRQPPGDVTDGRPLLGLARALAIESNAHSLRGEHNAALQSALDIVQLGADARRGGGTIPYSVGHALSARAHHDIPDAVPHLNAAQAKSAARRLEKLLETRWTLRQSLAEAKYAEQKMFFDSFGQKNWRMIGVLGTKPPLWLGILRTYTVPKKQILSDIAAKYDHEIANTRLAFVRQKPPLAFPDDGFADFIKPFVRVHFYDARAQTQNRALLLRLAIRAYQLERGAPPPNLGALVPNYLAAVPADPFGAGEPLRYNVRGKTYKLWSIGFDGADDGGKLIHKSQTAPARSAAQRAQLPKDLADSWGDYVAGQKY